MTRISTQSRATSFLSPSLMLWYCSMILCIFIFSCSNKDQASTEVESEIAILKGSAATGYALAAKRLEVHKSDGELLADTLTDAEGKFAIPLSRSKVRSDEPLLLSVEYRNGEEFFGIAYLNDSVYALINPLTDYIARTKFGILSELELREDLDKMEWDEAGESLIDLLFGADAEFEDFYDNEEFDAYIQDVTDDEVSLEDLLLHTLDLMAEQREIPLDVLLTEVEAEGVVLADQEEFLIALNHTFVELDLDKEELEEEFIVFLEEDEYMRLEEYFDMSSEVFQSPSWTSLEDINGMPSSEDYEEMLLYIISDVLLTVEDEDPEDPANLTALPFLISEPLFTVLSEVTELNNSEDELELIESYLSNYAFSVLTVPLLFSDSIWATAKMDLVDLMKEAGNQHLTPQQTISEYIASGTPTDDIFGLEIEETIETWVLGQISTVPELNYLQTHITDLEEMETEIAAE